MAIWFNANKKRPFWFALSILAALTICYWNSFSASWQYDDYPNIVHNDRVKMDRVEADQLFLALNAGQPGQIIARPLAYLTFALNYRLGGSAVFGFHAVNFFIHCFSSLFLFLWVRGTMRLPIFGGRYDDKATLIAWIATLFWACHPIHVTAVTYIVQRMTSMEGMFHVMAMYFYMSGRRADSGNRRYVAYGLCALSTIGALLTKENAVLLPYAFLLYDLFFFQEIGLRSVAKATAVGVLMTVLLGALSLLYLDPHHLLKPYENRPFTMFERVISQPRILFFYLSLLALPMTMRMSILHDVAISHSLFDPWSTLPALAGVAIAVLLLCLLARRHRLLAFSCLFFFLSHSVESSFLNLELIYEHRNYVPSMLLFVPVAVMTIRSIDYFYYRPVFQLGICCGLVLWFACAVDTTLTYNRAFQNEYTLWNHTNAIYPHLSAPYVNLSKVFWQAGDHEAAYKLNLKAVAVDNFKNRDQKGTAYYNLGLYLSDDLNAYSRALLQFERALGYFDENPNIWRKLGETHMRVGSFREGAAVIDEGLEKWPDDTDLLSLKALNRLKTGRYREASTVAERLLETPSEQDKIAWMILAESRRRLGDRERSSDCWQRLLALDPDNTAALMALIEMSVSLDTPKALIKEYVCKLMEIELGKRVLNSQSYSFENPNMMPYLPDLELIKEIAASYGGYDCSLPP